MDTQSSNQLKTQAVKSLRQSIICDGCRSVFGYSPEQLNVKVVDDYVYEVGVFCPHCTRWYRAYWLNTDLKRQLIELEQRRTRQGWRKFSHEFKKFQGRMKKKVYAIR